MFKETHTVLTLLALSMVDSCCRLWSTQPHVMTSLRLYLKAVSLSHYKANSVFIEFIRTTWEVLEGFQSFYFLLSPCIL